MCSLILRQRILQGLALCVQRDAVMRITLFRHRGPPVLSASEGRHPASERPRAMGLWMAGSSPAVTNGSGSLRDLGDIVKVVEEWEIAQ